MHEASATMTPPLRQIATAELELLEVQMLDAVPDEVEDDLEVTLPVNKLDANEPQAADTFVPAAASTVALPVS